MVSVSKRFLLEENKSPPNEEGYLQRHHQGLAPSARSETVEWTFESETCIEGTVETPAQRVPAKTSVCVGLCIAANCQFLWHSSQGRHHLLKALSHGTLSTQLLF